MANISGYLENILKAIFGKDVRQSIHDGIQAINNEVVENTTLTSNTAVRQNLLEQKYDEQIENIASGEYQNAEIVDARAGQTTLGNLLKKKMYYFENVATMKSCLTLIPGDVVQTLGYYEANDGGEGLYKIKETSVNYYETLSNGLVAELEIGNSVTPEMFGAHGNGISDDSTAFNNLFNYLKNRKVNIGVRFDNYIPEIKVLNKYLLSNPVEIPSRMNFHLNGTGILKGNNNLLEFSSLGDKCTITGVTFYTTSGYCIYINDAANLNAPHLSIHKCSFNGSSNGIYIRARSSRVTINECFLYKIVGYAINNRICDFVSINNTWIQDPILDENSPECYIRSEGGNIFLNDCCCIPSSVNTQYDANRYWIGMFENVLDGSTDSQGNNYYMNRLYSRNTRYSAEPGKHNIVYYDNHSEPGVGISSAIIIEDSMHLVGGTAITLNQLPTFIKFTGNNIQETTNNEQFLKVTNTFNYQTIDNYITTNNIQKRIRIIFENNTIKGENYIDNFPNQLLMFLKTDYDKMIKLVENQTVDVPVYFQRTSTGITQKLLVKLRGRTLTTNGENQVNEAWYLVSFEVISNGTGVSPVINRIIGNDRSPELTVKINNLDNIPVASGSFSPTINFSSSNILYTPDRTYSPIISINLLN